MTTPGQHMVDRQLAARGLRDERVLRAMARVPRDAFVPPGERDAAWDDRPLPIGLGQTISQPYVVGLISELAQVGPDDVVLEVGAGSGYQAAVLGELARAVYAVEIRPELAAQARVNLEVAGADNVRVRAGDGGEGWPEHAPFHAIVVSAAVPAVPAPLIAQLADGGRLVAPVGRPDAQELVRIVKRGNRLETSSHGQVRFVSFIGAFGNPQD